ncbi:MAG TPA: hypothetical protein HPP97_12755 [Desulfuromonadales bacterium]|nr:hypothetical protein [Desulfuromonadales bacterium]
MKSVRKHCIDCGSEAVEILVDEVKPVFKMEIVSFACGAEFKSVYSANGNVGKVLHSGCSKGNELPSV